MTRLTKVYTLNPGIEERAAIEQLQKTQDELPEGAVLSLFRRNDKDMQIAIRWLPFGDLVQMIDFPKAWQAQEFDDSEAYQSQNKRTKGFFSNIATISCTLVD